MSSAAESRSQSRTYEARDRAVACRRTSKSALRTSTTSKLLLAGQFALACTDHAARRIAVAADHRGLGRGLALGGVISGFAAWTLKPEARPVIRAVHRHTRRRRGHAAWRGARSPSRPTAAAFVYTGHRRFLSTPHGYARGAAALGFARRGRSAQRESHLLAGRPVDRVFPTLGSCVAWPSRAGRRWPSRPRKEIAPAGISWEANGTILYAQGRGGIWRVAENGDSPSRVVTEEAGEAMAPQLLPGGEWILYTLFLPPDSVSEIRVASTSRRASNARCARTLHPLATSKRVISSMRWRGCFYCCALRRAPPRVLGRARARRRRCASADIRSESIRRCR